jgi:hypothetical protein
VRAVFWHANKAVVRYCQPLFKRLAGDADKDRSWEEFFKMWYTIIQSEDEGTFTERVQQLKSTYLPIYVESVAYIETQWLDLYK